MAMLQCNVQSGREVLSKNTLFDLFMALASIGSNWTQHCKKWCGSDKVEFLLHIFIAYCDTYLLTISKSFLSDGNAGRPRWSSVNCSLGASVGMINLIVSSLNMEGLSGSAVSKGG